MLHIHEAVMVICHAYPKHLRDRGRDLKKDCFYHSLHPYLHDALSFALAELLEREQAHTSFNTLIHIGQEVGSWTASMYSAVCSEF